MADEPTPTPTPEPEPTPTPSEDAPQWAIDLKAAIESIPQKLRLTLSDDDKTQIGQGVFDLFDQRGVFERESAAPSNDPATPSEPATSGEPETPPQKRGLSGIAAWFEGDAR